MTKLLVLFAVVGLATSANAEVSSVTNATKADATSAWEGSKQISTDGAEQVRQSESLAALSSTGEAVAKRVSDVLSSRAAAIQKGDDVSSSDGSTNAVSGVTNDGKSALTGTYNMVVNVSGAVSQSKTVELAGQGLVSVSEATLSVAKALYNSFSISAQGASKVASSVTNGENPLSVTSETTADAAGELLSVDDRQKANKLKYKYLAIAEAAEGNWNAGIDTAIAIGEFNTAAEAVHAGFKAEEAPLAIVLAAAAARGEIQL